MQFKENKAIYLQVADLICEDIMHGKFANDEKIPSVREYAAVVEVNVNTCARAYEYLQGLDIIYTKRGLGYFVYEGAKESIHKMKCKEFIAELIPQVVTQMESLHISLDELNQEIIKYQTNKKHEQK